MATSKDLEKAEDCGREDAEDWVLETSPSEWKAAIAPGCLGADEALVNAIGAKAARKLLGVPDGDDPRDYYQAYSLAWATRVAEEIEANRGG